MRRFAKLCLVTTILGSAGVCFVQLQRQPLSAGYQPDGGIGLRRSIAIATLKHIAAAQARCQASGVIDVNNNGVGEYGFFGELSGGVGVREAGGNGTPISPPMLSRAFSNVDPNSQVVRTGYVFQMYLPDSTSQGVTEVAGTNPPTRHMGGDPGNTQGVDAARAEVLWCCYAWPFTFGLSGNDALFINQSGKVLRSRNHVTKYNGASRPPMPMAAFLPAQANIGGTIAADKIGSDGERWVVIQ